MAKKRTYHDLINTDHTYERKWRCDECGKSLWHSYDGMIEVGDPICPHCDHEMKLLVEARITVRG
jgi:hypothetical protein